MFYYLDSLIKSISIMWDYVIDWLNWKSMSEDVGVVFCLIKI